MRLSQTLRRIAVVNGTLAMFEDVAKMYQGKQLKDGSGTWIQFPGKTGFKMDPGHNFYSVKVDIGNETQKSEFDVRFRWLSEDSKGLKTYVNVAIDNYESKTNVAPTIETFGDYVLAAAASILKQKTEAAVVMEKADKLLPKVKRQAKELIEEYFPGSSIKTEIHKDDHKYLMSLRFQDKPQHYLSITLCNDTGWVIQTDLDESGLKAPVVTECRKKLQRLRLQDRDHEEIRKSLEFDDSKK